MSEIHFNLISKHCKLKRKPCFSIILFFEASEKCSFHTCKGNNYDILFFVTKTFRKG